MVSSNNESDAGREAILPPFVQCLPSFGGCGQRRRNIDTRKMEGSYQPGGESLATHNVTIPIFDEKIAARRILMAYQYEVVVIGSGSAGNEACLGAAKAGLSTLLVEEGSLGGTGMHRGSYAVRALRACATYFSRIENAAKAGASVGTVESDWTRWMTAQRRSSSDLSVEFSPSFAVSIEKREN